MTYNSFYFIIFFAAFLLVYSMMPRVFLRQLVLLVGNLVFYVTAGGKSCLVVLTATFVVVYLASRRMASIYEGLDEEQREMTARGMPEKKAAREAAKLLPEYKKQTITVLLPALIVVFGILIFVKAGRLLSFEEVTSIRKFRMGRILVPLGLSYYTFSAAGYLLDVYWRKAKAEKNGLLLFLCMTNFLTVVQGPIGRYNKQMKQLKQLPPFRYVRVTQGLQLMLWGFFKKMVVADRLSIYSQTVFGSISRYAGLEVVLAVLANVMCLYTDFSGCMDIVCGAGEAMGIVLDANFRQPFFSRSAAEFWRRWHITLGQWFKDYVYMPIAMSPRFMKFGFAIRQKRGLRAAQIASTAIPLLVVWILTGLWHGTGWNYFIWGLYWGILILLGEIGRPLFAKMTEGLGLSPDSSWFSLFQMGRTFVLFAAGRMITALGNGKSFFVIMGRIAAESRIWRLFDGGLYKMGLDQKDFQLALLGVLLVWLADILQSRVRVRDMIARMPLIVRWAVFYAGIAAVVLFGIYGSSYDASSFIYGAF